MGFVFKPPLILFHDDRPGQHATLFAPNGQRFKFRDDQSSFKDAHSDYTWAFEGHLDEGDRIVFATSDREVVGRLQNGEIITEARVDTRSLVVRNEEAQPVASPGAHRSMAVTEIVASPFPRSRPRPIPMPRPKR